MGDEELQEEAQQSEGAEGSGRLRSIERSRLRGPQSRVGVKRRQTAKKQSALSNRDERVQSRPAKQKMRKKGGSKKALVFFMLIVVATLFLLTTVFSSAHLNLTLTSVELPIDGVFAAIREPAQSKDITYKQFPPITEVREATVTIVTRERQNTHAEGTVTIYNVNPSGESLDLLDRTRLQTTDGREYRVAGEHTIPGGKTRGGVFVPGTKDVKVVASGMGNKYNLSEVGTRLSVPGLVRHKTFSETHGVTKTKIVGGFSGERLIPDESEEEVVREQLRRDIEKALRDSLAQSVANNSLAERVVFEEGIFIDFESLENTQNNGAVVVREEGTLYAVSFRQSELASLLAKYAPSTVQTAQPPTRVEVKNLSMKIESRDDFDVISSTEFSFRLSGSATLFWDIDKVLFLGDVVGKTRSEVKDVIAGEYSQIKSINDFSLFPAWRTSLPKNKKKIEITVGH